MPLIANWRLHVGLYLTVLVVVVPGAQYIFSTGLPSCQFLGAPDKAGPRVFDCFLYHSESYMLYLHLLTLAGWVDKFVIGSSNQSFTTSEFSAVTYEPFEAEIRGFGDKLVFLHIDFDRLRLAESKYRNETAWKREATARNHLIEGVKRFQPDPDDLVLLCDVDEIATRPGVRLIKRQPPVHYYNLYGLLFHYSFRWQVGEWERPLVIRYGSIAAPLDDYKFKPFLFPLPGVLHYHCSFCFPDMHDILRKLRSFSHTEYSQGKFRDPDYVYARIACGYGVLPPRWKMPEKLTLVDFDSRAIFVPNDARFDFLRYRLGFRDLGEYKFNATKMREYIPSDCTLKIQTNADIGTLM